MTETVPMSAYVYETALTSLRTDRNTETTVLVLGSAMLIVLTQYMVRYVVSYGKEGRRVESETDSSTDYKMRVKRLSDTMYVAVLLFFAGAMMKILNSTVGALFFGFCSLVFFAITTSLLGRVVGPKWGFGACDRSQACNGLREWIIFLIISFFILYMMRRSPARLVWILFGVVTLVSAILTTIKFKEVENTFDDQGHENLVITDMALEWIKLILLVLAAIYSVKRWGVGNIFSGANAPNQDASGAEQGVAFGEDASSIF